MSKQREDFNSKLKAVKAEVSSQFALWMFFCIVPHLQCCACFLHQAEVQLQRFAALASEKIVAVGGNTDDVSYELLTSQTTVNNENHLVKSASLPGAFVRQSYNHSASRRRNW